MSKESKKLTEEEFVAAFKALHPVIQKRVFAQLKNPFGNENLSINTFMEELRDKRFRKGIACPHCDSVKVVRNGTRKGRQKYMCSACSRHFSDHTHTPLRGTHYPDLWPIFMEDMISGKSIRETAKRLNVAVSTIFNWRHKVLTALKRMEPKEFEGLLEVDETYFLYSEKGNKNIVGRKPRKRGGSSKTRGLGPDQVCVFVGRDRTKETHAKVACMGQINKAKAQSILAPYVKAVSTICSDANSTWKAFTRSAKKDHVILNASKNERVKNIYHIQNVNAFHSRLKCWMGRFKGVATKFLDNYLTWFRFIDAHSPQAVSTKKLELLLTACLPISPERYIDIQNTNFSLP
jgi:transposase-like protein